MSKIHHLRAATVFTALTLALVLNVSEPGAQSALAAPAPAAATAPNIVVARPPAAGQAVVAPPPAAAPAPALAQAAPPPVAGAAGAAQPRIIVIDRNFILQRSSAGQDMLGQVQTLTKAAEAEFKNQEQALATEAGQLQQQMAIMAPDVRDQKEKEFTGKQQAFQGRVQQRQAEIQAGFNKAARQVEIALEPILKAIMVERSANMVLDRSAVILSAADVDVTPVAVQRLDKALPHVKVELTPVAATAAAAPAAPRPTTTPAITPPAAPAAGRR